MCLATCLKIVNVNWSVSCIELFTCPAKNHPAKIAFAMWKNSFWHVNDLKKSSGCRLQKANPVGLRETTIFFTEQYEHYCSAVGRLHMFCWLMCRSSWPIKTHLALIKNYFCMHLCMTQLTCIHEGDFTSKANFYQQKRTFSAKYRNELWCIYLLPLHVNAVL